MAQVSEEYAHLPRLDFVRGRFRSCRELASRDLFFTAKGRALNERATRQPGGRVPVAGGRAEGAGISPDGSAL